MGGFHSHLLVIVFYVRHSEFGAHIPTHYNFSHLARLQQMLSVFTCSDVKVSLDFVESQGAVDPTRVVLGVRNELPVGDGSQKRPLVTRVPQQVLHQVVLLPQVLVEHLDRVEVLPLKKTSWR